MSEKKSACVDKVVHGCHYQWNKKACGFRSQIVDSPVCDYNDFGRCTNKDAWPNRGKETANIEIPVFRDKLGNHTCGTDDGDCPFLSFLWVGDVSVCLLGENRELCYRNDGDFSLLPVCKLVEK